MTIGLEVMKWWKFALHPDNCQLRRWAISRIRGAFTEIGKEETKQRTGKDIELLICDHRELDTHLRMTHSSRFGCPGTGCLRILTGDWREKPALNPSRNR